MIKLASVLSGIALAAALGLANVPGASADPLAQIEGRSIDLGRNVHGTVYYVAGRDGAYDVVTTIDAGPDSSPVRFEATLADGQSLKISTPRDVGRPAQTVSVHRTGARVNISGNNGPSID